MIMNTEELGERLQQMSSQLGYEGREEERKAIIKEHLIDTIEEIDDLNLQDIAKDPDLIHDHHIYDEWMMCSHCIYLFFDMDILHVVNDFLKEFRKYGQEIQDRLTQEIQDVALSGFYANQIVFENINQWAEEEKKGVSNG
jgi:SpoVK/Ycf46/Vps4 family AAA+-type ATPase